MVWDKISLPELDLAGTLLCDVSSVSSQHRPCMSQDLQLCVASPYPTGTPDARIAYMLCPTTQATAIQP